MKRWGHVEGTGIGARADGIVHALAAEHVQKQLDPAKMSKRQVAKQKAAAANAKKRKWVQAPNARGKIVNANEDVRAAAERDKLGDASRIVCLVGLVESEEEVDEELSDEIGEECSKWGIVERVVLHMVEPPPEEPGECLRVFVVFSGLAGAWRATKELDGRFFGGRKIVSVALEQYDLHCRPLNTLMRAASTAEIGTVRSSHEQIAHAGGTKVLAVFPRAFNQNHGFTACRIATASRPT